MKITLIQSDLFFDEKQKNLDAFAEKINSIKEQTDLIILPEMFSTAFSMETEKLAEEMNGQTLEWLKNQAKNKDAAIISSCIIQEKNNYYNRLFFVFPDGNFEYYDKRHLFRMGNEHEHYTAGSEKLIVEYKGWKICPLVCYDLRFPVWSRNKEQYDLLIYIANWPSARSEQWKKLLFARAIENQTFLAAVNRIGEDKNKLPHSGDSMIIDPTGEAILSLKPNEERIKTIEISKEKLEKFRTNFPVTLDADDFSIHF